MPEEMFWPPVKMHLIAKDKARKLSFPMNLTLHIASPSLASNLTRPNTTFYNKTRHRAFEPPQRGLQKTKILGWYSRPKNNNKKL